MNDALSISSRDQFAGSRPAKRRWLVNLLRCAIICMFVQRAIGQTPSATELLKQSIASQQLPDRYSYHIDSRTRHIYGETKPRKNVPDVQIDASNVYRDGSRYDTASLMSLSIGDSTPKPNNVVRMVRADDQTLVRQQGLAGSTELLVILKKSRPMSEMQRGTMFDGFFYNESKPVAAALLESGNAAIKGDESIDGSPCTIIEGKTPAGLFTVWLDKGAGYAVRKAHVIRKPGDLQFGAPLTGDFSSEGTIEIKSIEKFGDIFLGTAAVETIRYSKAGVFLSGEEITATRTRLTLTPDFSKAFQLQNIPNGTPVLMMENQIDHSNIWQDGKVVKRPPPTTAK